MATALGDQADASQTDPTQDGSLIAFIKGAVDFLSRLWSAAVGEWSEIASADNAVATATHAGGGAGTTHYITHVSASYEVNGDRGLLQIKDGTTVIAEHYVEDSVVLTWPNGLPVSDNADAVAELAASGTAGNLGKVNIAGFTR